MARYSVNNYTVETLLSNIKSGSIAIPEMQRPFVWDSSKVRDLVDSLYKEFPVGYIIVWQNPDVKLKDGTKSSGKKVLIDGQQRITAMAAAIVGQEVLDDHYKWKRIFAMLNIASTGMVHLDGEQDCREFHPALVAQMARAFPGVVVAIKTAHYWVGRPYDADHAPWASVDSMVEAAELSGLPCMADFQPNGPERTYQDLVLKHLRPGDIHTHVYAQQFPILDENGKVNDFLFQARERGIVFDLGHGAGSFWFRNAVPALRQGFYPDTISTDLYLDNVAGPVIGLLHVMSKYLSMGMPLPEVIMRTTKRPAEVLGMKGVGNLSVGGCADVAVLRTVEGPVHFADSGHARMAGNVRLECMATLRGGDIVYDPYSGVAGSKWSGGRKRPSV